MTQPTINLNADLGESFGAWHMGDDAALLQVVGRPTSPVASTQATRW